MMNEKRSWVTGKAGALFPFKIRGDVQTAEIEWGVVNKNDLDTILIYKANTAAGGNDNQFEIDYDETADVTSVKPVLLSVDTFPLDADTYFHQLRITNADDDVDLPIEGDFVLGKTMFTPDAAMPVFNAKKYGFSKYVKLQVVPGDPVTFNELFEPWGFSGTISYRIQDNILKVKSTTDEFTVDFYERCGLNTNGTVFNGQFWVQLPQGWDGYSSFTIEIVGM